MLALAVRLLFSGRRHHAVTHGLSKTPEYWAWRGARQRCNNPNCPQFPRYGGRGIRVCSRWDRPDGFVLFLADMGRRPKNTTLERRNVNRGYSLNNCFWGTRKEQTRNRRTTPKYEFAGLTLSLGEWAERVGITYNAMRGRLNQGWPIAVAFTTGKTYGTLSKAEIRKRRLARCTVWNAVASGRLSRPEHCEYFGCVEQERLAAHHTDYNRPLNVKWYCRVHHKVRDAELRRGCAVLEAEKNPR